MAVMKIDEEFLKEAGLGDIDPTEKTLLLKQIYGTLETRVGKRIMIDLTEEQLKDFEQIIDAKNTDKARGWLSTNYPNYSLVVQEELQRLKSEIKKDAPAIIESIKNGQSSDS